MSSIPTGQGNGRYIIRSDDPRKLAEFIEGITPDSGIEVVDLIGPVGAPHTAVVTMPHQLAVSLKQHFLKSNQLTIEPDRPLSLFGDM